MKPVGQAGDRLLRIRVKVKVEDESAIKAIFAESGVKTSGLYFRVDMQEDQTKLEREIHNSQRVIWFNKPSEVRKGFSIDDLRKLVEKHVRQEIRCGFSVKPGCFGIRAQGVPEKEYLELVDTIKQRSESQISSDGAFKYEMTGVPPEAEPQLVMDAFATAGWTLLGVSVLSDKFAASNVRWLLRSNLPMPRR